MAKKSLIARDVKRKMMVERYAAAAALMSVQRCQGPMERLEIHLIRACPATAL